MTHYRQIELDFWEKRMARSREKPPQQMILPPVDPTPPKRPSLFHQVFSGWPT